MDKGQFLLYQTPDGDSQIEVKLQNDTVWLSLDQMAELFQRNKSTISRHILIYAGKISAKLAKEKADKEYDKFYTVSVWATYALYV